MLPIIIGGLIGAAITAVAMSDDKKCDESKETQNPEDSVEKKTSSETIKELRDQINTSLEELKSIS
jgi:hypothetical protein